MRTDNAPFKGSSANGGLRVAFTYPLGEVKGGDAQRPEAAEHGEDGQAQVVPRRDHDEVVLALAVAGAVRLRRGGGSRSAHLNSRTTAKDAAASTNSQGILPLSTHVQTLQSQLTFNWKILCFSIKLDSRWFLFLVSRYIRDI